MQDALAKFTAIAERISLNLQLNRAQSERFSLRNELIKATPAAIESLKSAGQDPSCITRVTLAATQYIRRFQNEWFACHAILKSVPRNKAGGSVARRKAGSGGAPTKYTDEQLDSFSKWWAEYSRHCGSTRPTHQGFLEWGEAQDTVDFPCDANEVELLKRALRHRKGKTRQQNKSKR